jgi:hypothetical protein
MSKKRKKKYNWKNKYIFLAYEYAKSGLSDFRIIKALGITYPYFEKWLKEKPLFKKAIKKGRQMRRDMKGNEISFEEYIYQQLSPEMKEVYDDLVKIDEEGGGVAEIEALLENKGKRFKQRMFIHSLVMMNYALSSALRRTGVPYRTFIKWKEEDPEFAELMAEIKFHKKNFYEDALNHQIKEGDTQCIIFANRTYNADRFMEPKHQIEINKNVYKKSISVVAIDDLKLSLEEKRKLLEKVRDVKAIESKEENALPPAMYEGRLLNGADAEYTETVSGDR